MSAQPICPDLSELRCHALGQLPTEEADLEQHLLGCDRCAEALQAFLLGDRLAAVVQQAATVTSRPRGVDVQALISRVSRLTPALAEILRLLTPSQEAEELGRLGPYPIFEVLGTGGMGVVFRGRDPQLLRSVALKIMLPTLAVIPSARKRFLREAQAVAVVKHDHVVTIHQVSEDGGTPFLVMELLEGETLEDRLRREGTLSVADALRIGWEIATGLAAAHARGLVHRDVKPSNVWLEVPNGRVKILDFGLANTGHDGESAGVAPTISGNGSEGLTTASAVLGTPAYMAPEQATGEVVGARADLFSLGCVLYRICTGTLPFAGRERVVTFDGRSGEGPIPLCVLCPAAPRVLSDLVMQLLAIDPNRRPESAAAVSQKLASLGPRVTPVRRSWLVLAATLLVLQGVLAGALYLGSVPAPAPSTPGAPQERVGEVWRIGGVNHEVFCLAISLDGRHALLGEGLTLWRGEFVAPDAAGCGIRLYDLENGRELRRFPGQPDAVLGVAFAPDGRHVLSFDRAFRVWSLDTGQEVRTVPVNVADIRTATFLPDGEQALTGHIDGKVCLWDLKVGEMVRRFEGGPDPVGSVAISPDRRVVVASFTGDHIEGEYVQPRAPTMRAWDVASGKEMHRFDGGHSPVDRMALSPDGRFALYWRDKLELRLAEVETGNLVRQFKGHTGMIASVAFAPDGTRVLSAGGEGHEAGDGTIRLWDVQTGGELFRSHAHSRGVRCVVFSPDGRHALSGGVFDGTLRYWCLPP